MLHYVTMLHLQRLVVNFLIGNYFFETLKQNLAIKEIIKTKS